MTIKKNRIFDNTCDNQPRGSTQKARDRTGEDERSKKILDQASSQSVVMCAFSESKKKHRNFHDCVRVANSSLTSA
jgi:hypothetical protein